MRHLALVSAVSLSLLAPAARADDTSLEGRERAFELRERNLGARERRAELRALRDDQRDLARVEALSSRLETMRNARAPAPTWALVALDADVQRELASERLEGEAEQQGDQGAGRGPGEAGPGRRWGQDGDRQDRAADARERKGEVTQARRLEHLRQEWANLNGQYGRQGLERRRTLMAEFMRLARQELAADRRDLRLGDRR